jgi:hypothetical protein
VILQPRLGTATTAAGFSSYGCPPVSGGLRLGSCAGLYLDRPRNPGNARRARWDNERSFRAPALTCRGVLRGVLFFGLGRRLAGRGGGGGALARRAAFLSFATSTGELSSLRTTLMWSIDCRLLAIRCCEVIPATSDLARPLARTAAVVAASSKIARCLLRASAAACFTFADCAATVGPVG